MNCVVMSVSISVRDAMGAVLSWFGARLFALVLDTAGVLRHLRVSKRLLCVDVALKTQFKYCMRRNCDFDSVSGGN